MSKEIEEVRRQLKKGGLIPDKRIKSLLDYCYTLEERVKGLEIQVSYEQERNHNNVAQADIRIKELEKEADRQEKVFMEVVNKKSEQAGELQAVNEHLKKANFRIKKLEKTIKKLNEEIIHFCNTMERMIDKIIKKERF